LLAWPKRDCHRLTCGERGGIALGARLDEEHELLALLAREDHGRGELCLACDEIDLCVKVWRAAIAGEGDALIELKPSI